MKNMLVGLALALGVAACQSGTEYFGKGPLTLSSRVIDVMEDYRHGGDGIHENLVLAVDRHSRRIGGVYCPSTDIHACIDVSSLTASQAVDNCNKSGKYDCKVYSVIDKVVWRGPVFRRNSAAQHTEPYNGIWTPEIEWAAASGKTFRLIANEGSLTATGIVPGKTCEVDYRATSSDGGDMWINCGADASVHLSLAFASLNRVNGAGKDSEGRPVIMRLDLKAGTGTETASTG